MQNVISSVPLLANPYYTVVAELCKASWRLELIGEPPSRVEQRLIKASLQPALAGTCVHALTAESNTITGMPAALKATDPVAVSSIMTLLRGARCPPLPNYKGYASNIAFSVTGRSLDHRRLVPHLALMEAQEHVQISGPQRGDAMDLYTQHVLKHVTTLAKERNTSLVVSGVQLGGTQWTTSDLEIGGSEFMVSQGGNSSVLSVYTYLFSNSGALSNFSSYL